MALPLKAQMMPTWEWKNILISQFFAVTNRWQ